MPTATKPPRETSALKQYIGGKWVEGTHALVVDSVNPADTRDVVARFKSASKADALKAIEAGEKAAKGWAKTPAPQRGRVLARAAEIARRRRDELAAAFQRFKVLADSRKAVTLHDVFESAEVAA